MDIQMGKMRAVAGRELPTKTKAAMWFIFGVAGIEVLYGAWAQMHPYFLHTDSEDSFLLKLLYAAFYILPAAVLSRKSRGAFITAMSILSIYLIFLIVLVGIEIAEGSDVQRDRYLGESIFVLVPLVLLALDAKNYRKTAT